MRAIVTMAVLLAAGLPRLAGAWDLAGAQLVDLTHSFESGVLTWPINRPFVLEQDWAGVSEQGYYYAANSFCMAEHTGTHVDAPRHFHADGATVDALALERLIGPAVVVDVAAQARADRDYLIDVDDLTAFERAHGTIAAGTIVLLRTGFGAYWSDKARYAGTAATGPEAVAALHFPGLRPRAATWAVERRVAAIGLDTPSIDHGPSTRFESHVILAAAGIPAFENVAHLDRLPATGATVIALPMKIQGGTGGPLRIVAIVPSAAAALPSTGPAR